MASLEANESSTSRRMEGWVSAVEIERSINGWFDAAKKRFPCPSRNLLSMPCARTEENTCPSVFASDPEKKLLPAERSPKLLMTRTPCGLRTRLILSNASRVMRCDGEESPRNASRITASYFLVD